MKKITTVTIGIPAFNEANNIGKVLTNILSQKQTNYKLDKIIISSDGSTDETVKICNNFKTKLIKVIDNKGRQGISRGLNQVIRSTSSDILLILDADIRIFDKNFIQKLIEPIINKKADLTSCRLTEATPRNFYSKMLWVSQQVKNNVFENINHGDNLFNSKGPARAFSKKLYSKISFPKDVANDAISYLKCKELNLNFFFVKSAYVNYKLVDNFSDHQKQSLRFFQSTLHTHNIKLPLSECLLGVVKSTKIILRYPIHSFIYLLIQFYFQILAKFKPQDVDNWPMATSSK